MENEFAIKLLDWYQKFGRELPWRYKGGAHPNPYVVFVSEYMLQQTTVKTVIPYFYRFMERFPDVKTLAKATEDEVYELWQGLGYYSRARSLLASAKIIMKDFDGNIPNSKKEIQQLKGVGPYTSASILALGFNQRETVIDGNVMRIICRLYHLKEPLDTLQQTIKEKAQNLVSQTSPADYTSAIMDLGATICTPKNPQCLLCPWQEFCLSKNTPDIEKIPQKAKIVQKEIIGYVYLIYNKKGEIFIRKRTEKGLLTGLYEFPWSENKLFQNAQNTNVQVRHIFTHIKMTLNIYKLDTDILPTSDGFFIPISELKNYAFSTLMKKVAKKL